MSGSDQNSELASSGSPAAGSLETPKSDETPGDSGNIAAQQNETGDKS
jgi:hypothetical protein